MESGDEEPPSVPSFVKIKRRTRKLELADDADAFDPLKEPKRLRLPLPARSCGFKRNWLALRSCVLFAGLMQTTHGNPRLLTCAAVAEILSMSRRQVDRLTKAGALPVVRIDRRPRFLADDIEEFVQSRRHGA